MEVGPEWESFTGLNDYDYDDIYQLMNTFLKSKPTKFLCLVLSFLMLTLNLPDLSFACGTHHNSGRGDDETNDCWGASNHVVEATGNLNLSTVFFSIPGKGLPIAVMKEIRVKP